MIQRLVQQVQTLQDRVKALEPRQGSDGSIVANATTELAASPPVSQPEDTNKEHAQITQELHELRGIQWRGFGKVDYKVLNQRTPNVSDNIRQTTET